MYPLLLILLPITNDANGLMISYYGFGTAVAIDRSNTMEDDGPGLHAVQLQGMRIVTRVVREYLGLVVEAG